MEHALDSDPRDAGCKFWAPQTFQTFAFSCYLKNEAKVAQAQEADLAGAGLAGAHTPEGRAG